jgi:ESS family glutamate:Na+ symporter
VLILLAMGIGAWISGGLGALGLTLPSYIGAMLVGALIRNIDDHLGWFGLSLRSIDIIGNASLSLFLVVALMNLHLWDLTGLAMPLLVNLGVQSIVVVAFCCWPLWWLMGRDYDAAVMASGFVGFMLGTTANAMAVMSSLTERFGPAPRAFLVAPIVGAFLIDFTNAIVITFFINGWK